MRINNRPLKRSRSLNNEDDEIPPKRNNSNQTVNNKRTNPPPPLNRNLWRNNNNKKDENDDFFPIIIIKRSPNENEPTKKTNNFEDKDKEEKCPNPLCNHYDYIDDEDDVFIPNLEEIKDINDLISLGKSYHCKKNTYYHNINLKTLCKLVNPLTELNNMIGMKSVKENIINQILFFLLGYNVTETKDGLGKTTVNHDMLHTVITGPPGVGKTELGKILGKIYKDLGILSKGTFKLVSRSDLVAKYLGQTAAKTQEVIDECKGGVMFIDEAYSLGHSEGRDSFSKECLDTLNQNLSERRDFLCIIAGYKDDLEKCFFKMNEGLRRRFTFRYDIEGYNAKELLDIFLLKLKNEGWTVDMDEMEKLEKLFTDNKNNFPNYGGDIETLFLNCKIVHSRRVLFDDKKKRLSLEDIKKGIEYFLKHRKSKKPTYDSFYG